LSRSERPRFPHSFRPESSTSREFTRVNLQISPATYNKEMTNNYTHREAACERRYLEL
jgi:hypothetical protein